MLAASTVTDSRPATSSLRRRSSLPEDTSQTWSEPPGPAEISRLLSGEKRQTGLRSSRELNLWSASPVSVFHRQSPSAAMDDASLPSGETASAVTVLPCPGRWSSCRPEAVSHRKTSLPHELAHASVLLSGVKAKRAVTRALLSNCAFLSPFRSQRKTLLP